MLLLNRNESNVSDDPPKQSSLFEGIAPHSQRELFEQNQLIRTVTPTLLGAALTGAGWLQMIFGIMAAIYVAQYSPFYAGYAIFGSIFSGLATMGLGRLVDYCLTIIKLLQEMSANLQAEQREKL